MLSPSLSSQLDPCLLQLASQPGEILEDPIDLSDCFMDTTCVQAHIHFPVDWILFRDAIRTLMVAVERIRDLGLKCRLPKSPADYIKEINKLSIEMTHTHRVKGGQTRRKDILRQMKKRLKVVQGHAQRHVDLLMEKGSATLSGDGQVQQLLNQISQVIDQIPPIIKNAHERIIGGRPVANEDKIHSLYDENINVIVRRKAGSAVEFGNTLFLAEQRDGLIVDWELFRDSAPADARLLQPSQERIKERFGIDITLAAGDRGFDSEANRNYLEKENTFNAICPRNPHWLPERLKEEPFCEAQNRRCQTEGRISILGRCFSGNPLQQKSYAYRNLHMGLSILSHNLWKRARLKIAQTQAQLAEQAA